LRFRPLGRGCTQKGGSSRTENRSSGIRTVTCRKGNLTKDFLPSGFTFFRKI
jgi:hypothetical protein